MCPDSILTHIFNAANFYASEVEEYKAELYLKGLLKIHKRNRIIKYIPSMFPFGERSEHIHPRVHQQASLYSSQYLRPEGTVDIEHVSGKRKPFLRYSRLPEVQPLCSFHHGRQSTFPTQQGIKASITITCSTRSPTAVTEKSTSCVSSHAIPVPSYWKGRAGFLPVTGPSATSIFKGNMT